MTDVGVKNDRFFGRSVMAGSFVVVRASFVVGGQGHLRDPSFDLSIGACQAGGGGAGGLGGG